MELKLYEINIDKLKKLKPELEKLQYLQIP